jgi:hypothetical protein
MASLLDTLFGAPGSDQSQAMGLLADGLINGKGARGFSAANQFYAQAPQRAMQQQLAQMQLERERLGLDKARREDSIEQQIGAAAKSSYRSPEMAAAMSAGPTPDGGAVPQVASGFDGKAFLDQLFQINPMKAVAFEQSMAKDNSPLSVAPGASLVDRKTMKSVFTAPTAPKEESMPASVKEYEYAQNQGYKGSFEQFQQAQKRAGASNTSISVNTEKSLLSNMGEGLGKAMVEARTNAQGALSTIGTVGRLNEALNSGQAMAGPGTTFRQFGLQIGNVLGVTGKDAQEKLLNTRQAVQSLAQLELDAAQQMKGQGQITEAERSIIRRAASGDVDSMTVPELRLLGGVLDRSARTKIRSYNTQVAPLKSNPNAAPLAPFLDVQEPEAAVTPGVMRFDARGNLITR